MAERTGIAGGDVFPRLTPTRQSVAELERVEEMVRARYGIAEAEIVLVTEEAGRAAGFPDRMTTILFWTGPGERHRIRLFKPVCDVREDDLPQPWLRGALRDEGEGDCC